jgi:hypothetical protein
LYCLILSSFLFFLQVKLDSLFDKGLLRKAEIDTVLLEDIESEPPAAGCWLLTADSARGDAAAHCRRAAHCNKQGGCSSCGPADGQLLQLLLLMFWPRLADLPLLPLLLPLPCCRAG